MDIKTQIKMVRSFNAAQLNATTKKAAEQYNIRQGRTCPACDSRETESNGHTEYRCEDCDHRWGCEGGEWYGIEVAA